MQLIDPATLPSDHPALVPDLWVRAMLAHPALDDTARQQALKSAGLPTHEIDDTDLKVTQNHEIVILSTLTQILDQRTFATQAPGFLDLRHGSILTYISLAADTIHEALTLLARYLPITRPKAKLQLEPAPDGVVAVLSNAEHGLPGHDLYREFAAAILIQMVEVASAQKGLVHLVRFTHAQPNNMPDVEQVLGCSVEFGAPRNELHFSAASLDQAVVSSDAKLLKHLRAYGNILLQNREPGSPDICRDVEQVVLPRLPHGLPTIREVADRLSISERTLSRRLAVRGTTYRQLIDKLRYDLTAHYLADPSLTLAEIAYLLGYSDQSSFGAAFRRQSGATPRQFRSAL